MSGNANLKNKNRELKMIHCGERVNTFMELVKKVLCKIMQL